MSAAIDAAGASESAGMPHEAVACVYCGAHAADRLYAKLAQGCACEHCLLDRCKSAAGIGEEAYEGLVEALAAALDLRERETGLHSKRVACHTLVLARHFYSELDFLRQVYWGSLLHDIGKIGVPDAILLKSGPLDEQEWAVMRRHPDAGFQHLANFTQLTLAADIVRCHEERFDGSGYPRGLSGDAIPLPARLFAVIDTLDAMTSERPYRRGLDFEAAKSEIVKMSGSQFDPVAVEAFIAEEDRLRQMVALQCILLAGIDAGALTQNP